MVAPFLVGTVVWFERDFRSGTSAQVSGNVMRPQGIVSYGELERPTGIEPVAPTWEAGVLPLYEGRLEAGILRLAEAHDGGDRQPVPALADEIAPIDEIDVERIDRAIAQAELVARLVRAGWSGRHRLPEHLAGQRPDVVARAQVDAHAIGAVVGAEASVAKPAGIEVDARGVGEAEGRRQIGEYRGAVLFAEVVGEARGGGDAELADGARQEIGFHLRHGYGGVLAVRASSGDLHAHFDRPGEIGDAGRVHRGDGIAAGRSGIPRFDLAGPRRGNLRGVDLIGSARAENTAANQRERKR